MESSLPTAFKEPDHFPVVPRFSVLMAITFVCFMILISTFTFYKNAQSRQIDLQNQMLELKINQVQRAIEVNIQKEAYFLVWLATRFQNEGEFTLKRWVALTGKIKNVLPSLNGVYWLNPDLKVLWTTPSQFKPNKEMTTHWRISPLIPSNAINKMPKIASSDVLTQKDGRLTIEMQYPVLVDNKMKGKIGISFYIDEMVNNIQSEFLTKEQHLVISHGSDPFIGRIPTNKEFLSKTVHLSSINDQWNMTVWQSFTREGVYFSFPMLIFVAGIIVTVLVGISLYLLEVNVMRRLGESRTVFKLKKEIIQRREAESQLQFIAKHDPQTHLPNLFAMEQYLERSIKSEQDIVLLCVALDSLREINDMYGHLVADLLLIEAAKRLKSVLPHNSILARVNRDQFMVACAGMSQLEAEMQANQLCMCLEDEFIIEESEILTAYSIGIAYRYDKEIRAEDMLRHADTAARKAKSVGTRKVVAYNQSMQEQLNSKKELESAIRKAINNDELQLHFQPQVDLRTRQIVGVEALVRWETDTGAIVSPEVIIKTAEETGLMQRLGQWVVDTALKQFSYMLDERCAPKCIAINVSGHEFQDGYLADYVIRSVTRYDIPPSRVQIELTEQVFIENLEHNQKTLNRLTTTGISLAIDDFGTGYSSLAYLKHFPVNTLKIDRCFVKDLPQSKDDLVICQAVVSMANLLQLKVVAEGVETVDQQELLRNIGCNFAQGHFYYPAMSAKDLIRLLKEQRAERFYPTA